MHGMLLQGASKPLVVKHAEDSRERQARLAQVWVFAFIEARALCTSASHRMCIIDVHVCVSDPCMATRVLRCHRLCTTKSSDVPHERLSTILCVWARSLYAAPSPSVCQKWGGEERVSCVCLKSRG
jgi:hypothetical protein